MTVRRDGELVRLEGDCMVEEAETLAALLADRATSSVDLSLSSNLHSAVVQTLLRFRPKIVGTSGSVFIRDVLGPALASANPDTR